MDAKIVTPSKKFEKDVPNPKKERDAQQSTKPSKPHPMGTASKTEGERECLMPVTSHCGGLLKNPTYITRPIYWPHYN